MIILMIQKLKKHKEQLVLLLMAAAIVCLGTCRFTDVGQPIVYPDEFGYWANSSLFIGRDWSTTVSTTYYYSYGYSLLMVPVRWLAENFFWNWQQMYQAMVILQNAMLAGAFLVAVKVSRRYMPQINWFVRDLACMAVFVYPTYVVYAHITWAEITLLLMFWIFLYTMMRLTDNPSWKTHVSFACVSFYMYMVHQRCLVIVIAAVVVVVCMRLLERNKLSHVVYFLGTLFLFNCVHNGIKGKLQNDFYLAKEPAGAYEVLGYILNTRTFILLAAAAFLVLCLWIAEQGKGKTALALVLTVVIAGIAYVIWNFSAFEEMAGDVDGRMAVNDFAGQLWKFKDIVTLPGFLRLLISMAGKWFYIASASGLIICFGIWSLGGRFIKTTVKGIVYIWKKYCTADRELPEYSGDVVWHWGAFLTWLGVFGLSAFAMMGIGRVDQLIYGRYQEFAVGIIMLYGFFGLVKDKKWVRHLIFFIAIYLLVGWLCQYLFNELENSEFASCNCVMLGQVIRGKQVPNGKIWQIAARSISACIALCCIIKAGQERFRKVQPYRIAIAAAAVICLYSYMGVSKTDDLVVTRNHTQERKTAAVATWINRLWRGEKIYFLRDSGERLSALSLQYKLYDKTVVMMRSENIQHGEDAFYVAKPSYMEREGVSDEYGVIVDIGDLVLFAPLDGNIYGGWRSYYSSW